MKDFIEKWKSKSLGFEKQDSHQFWNGLLRTFWKILNPDDIFKHEVPVQLEDSIRYIDFWIPKTRVIIEQKSRGKKLDKPERQSGGDFLTPFQQAKRYDDHRKTSEKARWIVTCNFDEIWIYNLEADRPELHVRKIKLEELPERFGELDFLVDETQSEIKTSEYVSASAGSLVQNFRDLFLDSISEMNHAEVVSLNKLCIRSVFCMYAEDSGIFERKIFLNYLKELRNKSLPEVKSDLASLFWRLNTKDLPSLGVDPRLKKFPYVNGNLFDGESLEILDRLDGSFDLRGMIDTLIDAAEKNIWSKISPTIFGSIFESIMNPETRRSGGIHFTSIENIHKVIDPLFLDDLNSEFKNGDLEKLHDKIANLKFFDPACGSGNFLTETYLSLRKLENRIIDQTHGKIRVSIENFFGIEINDFAVQVAKLALWISEHQMDGNEDFLPLTRETHITEGNSLEIDWKSVVPDANFVMGNPPFIGQNFRSETQRKDFEKFFDTKIVDYVACWFKKASEYIRDLKAEVGFVATNSITQGEQVYPIWNSMFEDGIKINFAWSSFRWENETVDRKNMAHVHCVIIGFSRFDRKIKLLDGNPVKNINGYLLDAPNVCIQPRTKSMNDVPQIINGSKFTDGGNLIIEEKDLDSFIQKDPRAKKFIRPLIGAEEFIHNKPRYCLWLVDAEPNELRSIKPIYERVEACRNFRLASKARTTRDKLSKFPMLVEHNSQPSNGNFIVIPRVSSERREYVPMDFLNIKTIATDALQIIPNGSLELFGILMSSVHMAWMRTVAGRLETRYRYTASIVYNNFPFPKPNPKIESTAQKILDARSQHPNSSLADLYDPNLMPMDLRKAHEENDKAVLDAYNFPKNISESEIVSRLFEMYEDLTNHAN